MNKPIFYIVIVASIFSCNMTNKTNKASYFTIGETKIIEQFTIGPQGKILNINNPGGPLHGLLVEIPYGTFDEDVILSIGHNNGKVFLNSGTGSGVVVVLQLSNNNIKFNHPVKLTIYENQKDSLIFGYAIDEDGGLEPIDTVKGSKEQNYVHFFTFKPIMFTWVFID